MKRIFYILLFLLPVVASAQTQIKFATTDTVRLKHTNYTAVFSKSLKYPVLIEWWTTKAMVTCPTPLKRKDAFKPDPLLPNETNIAADYVGSGTDRGHMMPAADNLCQTQAVQDECFYFSNMSAQYHSLNAGDWKSLETYTRQTAAVADSVKVWCGNIGVAKTIGKGTAVPTHCWKVIYIKSKNEWHAYLFANTTDKPDGMQNNEVPVAQIEKITGFKFKVK
jgi:endonuclease G